MDDDEDAASQASGGSAASAGSGVSGSTALSADAAVNQTTIYNTARRIHERLAQPESVALAVRDHNTAVKYMCKLQSLLEETRIVPGREVQELLLATGIAVQRRSSLSVNAYERSDLDVTLTLLFVLQTMCSPQSLATELVDERIIDRWHLQTLYFQISYEEPDEEAAEEDGEPAEPPPDPPVVVQEVCRTCLLMAASQGRAASLSSMQSLSRAFFQCSNHAICYNALRGEPSATGGADDFLTLSTMDVMRDANRDENIKAVVGLAESEAGQMVRLLTPTHGPHCAHKHTNRPDCSQVLRDMILSFTLPAGVVGVRRIPLLSRESNAKATEAYPFLLGSAHEAAQRGADWSYEEDPAEVHKMCAVLAGLAVLLAGRGKGTDAVRKNDAFNGRVQLPFLDTVSPAPNTMRLALLPDEHAWVVFQVRNSGAVKILMRESGLEGLVSCALHLTRKT